MAVNKVVYDGSTLIDLEQDNVTAADVMSGVAFHLPSGVASTGSHVCQYDTPTISVSSDGLITASANGKSATQQMTTQAAKTVTPGTSSQTAVASQRYTTGTITVVGDADLVAGNIISTANIFGVQGSVAISHWYSGASEPSSSLGANGDLYLMTG